ncbi:GIN domain-containing protein [Pedobacter sp. GSP4]|uniref:GIN domain-containing protein n=1 Tax=Pedobacter sp. GSP4 TaxID=3453716 RepID=UPI003EEEEBB8
MKTSNKLLIALAALLIVIPIVVIAVNVKLNYVSFKSDRFLAEQDINAEPFDKESDGRVSIPFNTSFNSVNVPDAKRIYLELHLIKSAKSGVKVPTDMKDGITFNVNKTGTLQVSFSDQLNRSGNNRYGVVILVYSPNIDQLNINNSSSIVLTAKTDSLSINATKSGNLSFGSPITFSSNGKFTRVINQTDIKKLNINLDSSVFNSSNISYRDLNISSKNSTVTMSGEDAKNNSIENLTINTFEKAYLKIENITVNKITGNFSDETTIAMPVKYLKQMLKK